MTFKGIGEQRSREQVTSCGWLVRRVGPMVAGGEKNRAKIVCVGEILDYKKI